MGVAFYPVFEDGSGNWHIDINGKCLARAADIFDEVCRRASVPTLYDFFSMSQDAMIVELLDGDPDDPSSFDATKLPPEYWFNATDGLKTVQVLLNHVALQPDQVPNYDYVRDDLEAFRQALTEAAEKKTRWRLAIDI